MGDSSKDVTCIDSDSVEAFVQAANDKPLLTLFKRLISNDTKENTVLTNAQIVDILKKEFDMDISYIHNLEIEIYLNLMKKFLKDWPLWDEFDETIQILKRMNDTEAIKKKLEENHKNLKSYLNKMLECAKPYMKDVIKEAKEAAPKVKAPEKTESDVVLEIHCTRQQLNQLFFRRPHPSLNNTIFNLNTTPNKISLQSISLLAMLNWPGIQLNVNSQSLSFRREIVHNLTHKLVNKKLNIPRDEPTALDTSLQMKDLKQISQYTLKDIHNIFSAQIFQLCFEEHTVAGTISEMINRDFLSTPDVTVPTSFRRTLNKYPYVRYLFSEVETDKASKGNLYDLQLEEAMVPTFTCTVSRIDKVVQQMQGNCLSIECTVCKVIIQNDFFVTLREHFASYHQCKANWTCTKCNHVFRMVTLAENNWSHDCTEFC